MALSNFRNQLLIIYFYPPTHSGDISLTHYLTLEDIFKVMPSVSYLFLEFTDPRQFIRLFVRPFSYAWFTLSDNFR